MMIKEPGLTQWSWYILSASNYQYAWDIFVSMYSLLEQQEVTKLQVDTMRDFFLLMRQIDYLYDAKIESKERYHFFLQGLLLLKYGKDNYWLLDLLGKDRIVHFTTLIQKMNYEEKLESILCDIYTYWEIQKTTSCYKEYIEATLHEWQKTWELSALLLSSIVWKKNNDTTINFFMQLWWVWNLIDNIADIHSDYKEQSVVVSPTLFFYIHSLLYTIKKIVSFARSIPFDAHLFSFLIRWLKETVKNNSRNK